MSVINTNIKSLISQNALTRNGRDVANAMQQLSTGKRINSAADDAAGLAISNKMTSQIRGLNQAVRNANDGISMLQTAEGATQEITNMLQRMRELAVQAANDTYSDTDRDALDKERVELEEEITRIAKNTKWNNMAFLDNAGVTKSFQVGIANNEDSTIAVQFVDLTASGLDVVGLDVSSHVASQSALDKIDTAIADVDDFRANVGAKINRLNFAIDNLTNISINTSASRSRIEDADFAKASSELARTQIIQQAATAVLAQANTDQQSVLKLLQG
ncbi:flagellin N-terminal helical domain-containing protein [Limnohabitans sp. 63ED37-2]|uniref:flagellin N-terminal helical domain-containing protein n=1 Tax=Limnohabitans sp. 63ED37-2 TaxID=1678128 RepID=UPI000706A9D8|nr:flagellin [Limnohabitans sp. 63ED37-2]ALK88985.1 Flagellin [Limnohabitans sp. 63ED37-2]